ncbi:hypothetical protein [Victivallis vadensis]|uniref:hypothetical protein n=1 Tax=Victivallis vadensis TaxID=172901 RepID=UPI003D0613A3
MAKQAFQQWYWSDWFGDTNVARLDPASRCVWFELLGIMSQEGTFQVSDDLSSLARATRTRVDVVAEALKKIDAKAVAQVIENNGVYTIISRRLEREMKRKDAVRERVKRFRNASGNASGNTSCNADVTPDVTDTRARYSETYKEKYIKENPDVERLIAVEAEEIVNLHPRRSDHRASVRAVIDAVWREADRGMPPEAALRMLRDRTVAYAEAVRGWPPGERRYIKGALAWYQNGCYADDPATWRQGKEAETPFSGNHEVVL